MVVILKFENYDFEDNDDDDGKEVIMGPDIQAVAFEQKFTHQYLLQILTIISISTLQP